MDELPSGTIITNIGFMDVPGDTGTNKQFSVTNIVAITTISVNPPLRQVRSDCYWTFPLENVRGNQHRHLVPHQRPMKLLTDKLVSPRCGQAAQTGFTLAEMMITLAVFSLAMIAMIGVQIFGLRVYTLSSSKMIATAGGRQLLDKMRDPIRSANTVVIGFYNNNSFTSVTNGAPQIGNAILISMVTNAFTAQNSIVFYHDMASSSLRIVTDDGDTVLANSITNDFCFEARHFEGTCSRII